MRAVVVGGGIAGPVAAMALQKVGVEATVLERRPQPDGETGSYFTISPNGLYALGVLGALDIVRRAGGFDTRRNVMVGATGRTLGSVSLGRPLEDGTTALTVKRSRLAEALAEEARRRGIELRHGARVTDARADRDTASVSLDDGSRIDADVVIGADGVHSVVRGAIDPDAPAPRYVGLTNFGGVTRSTPVAAQLPGEAWRFTFGRQAFFGCHATPSGDVVWFVNVPRPPITSEERAATTNEQWQARLAELLDGDAGPGAELVRAGELELAADNTYDLPRVPSWHRERLVVIGDAAHAPSPSSGQGASMAVEDGVALAAALRDGPSVQTALAAFEAQRRKRVERIVAVGARSSSAKTPGRIGRVFQEAALRLVFRLVVTDRSQEWVTGYRVSMDHEPRTAPATP